VIALLATFVAAGWPGGAGAQIPLVAARAVGTLQPNSPLSLPTDVAVAADGRVWVVDSGHDRIVAFDPQGRPAGAFGTRGEGAGQLRDPVGIGLGSDGTVWVADRGNHRLVGFAADGRSSRAIAAGDGDSTATPVDVVADATRLYVTLADRHGVVVIDPAGGPPRSFGSLGEKPGQFRYPAGIARDRDGTLLVVDALNSRVQRFAADGTDRQVIGHLGVLPGDLHRPKGIAVDARGRVYVSDSILGVVQVFAADGALVGVLATDGVVRRFEAPAGLAISERGRLYVTDMLAATVTAFDLEEAP
jgi:DNA-binding beta-propeller fold protein YncE